MPPTQAEPIIGEYRVYVERIVQALRPETFRTAMAATSAVASKLSSAEKRPFSGRALLEAALVDFTEKLGDFTTGRDDRKLSKASLRRARGIESQLANLSDQMLALLLRHGLLTPQDLHGIWRGFAAVRTWRDSKFPQECFLQFLQGALRELDEEVAEKWTEQALVQELSVPEVHQAISVSAWPSLCELLGRLPNCVTASELQDALWRQSFVENPTHAPEHRNHRRFAQLAAQMVAIGVELDSDKVEQLVRQTLDLDRPWRERRDMLSGILSAASVEDRQRIVHDLDRRFEEHADFDDFEIVCGIAEAIGVEVPRGGSIRRCALRRWALDPKRGGALPAARLIDFVDREVVIAQDVAASLRSRGRAADAALLLSRLPRDPGEEEADRARGPPDVANGDAELARLREILALDEDAVGGEGIFGPVEEGSLRLPFQRHDGVGFSECSADAMQATARLREASVLALGLWKEEAPFWHSPVTMLAVATDERVELFDLVALRSDPAGGWPEAASELRALLSASDTLKVTYDRDGLQGFAYTLGLGVASTLKPHDRVPLGPFVGLDSLIRATLGRERGAEVPIWPSVVKCYLGLRMCSEEAGNNWARRPLRDSQLHHAAVEVWTQLPVLRALCAHGIVPRPLAKRHFVVQEKVKASGQRVSRPKEKHVLGQLAPPGRLVDGGKDAADRAVRPVRIASLISGTAACRDLPALAPGTIVEVFEERFGCLATVAPLAVSGSGGEGSTRRVPTSKLRAVNGWGYPSWVEGLPRPCDADVPKAIRAECPAPVESKTTAGSSTGASASVNPAPSLEPSRQEEVRERQRHVAQPAREETGEPGGASASDLLDNLFNNCLAQEALNKLYAAQV